MTGHAGRLQNRELLFYDCFNRAVLSAGAAVDTDISVDYVLVVALSDSLNGAVVNTGAAVDTSVGNSESHGFPSSVYMMVHQKPDALIF